MVAGAIQEYMMSLNKKTGTRICILHTDELASKDRVPGAPRLFGPLELAKTFSQSEGFYS